MTVQKTSSLPFQDQYKVDIQIRIKWAGEKFKAYISSAYSSEHPLIISITEADLKDLNKTLQDALDRVRDSFDGTHPPEEQNGALTLLATKGSYAFNKIFSAQSSRDLIALALKSCNVLQITSKSFVLPWEVLYDCPLDQEVNVMGFWGMRYLLTRIIPEPERPGDFLSSTIQSSKPRVNMLTCRELIHVVKDEIPNLERLHSRGRIRLAVLPPLDSDRLSDGLRDLKQFLQLDSEIIHLACHAFQGQEASESRLRIDQEFDLTIESYTSRQFSLSNFPLVILNACRTGTTDPSRTTNWASQFWGTGARGVLATEFRVPDWFAASFIDQMYKRLLDRRNPKPLGKSLMESRHHFWNKDRNVLGLAYALYSSPNINFVNEEKLQ